MDDGIGFFGIVIYLAIIVVVVAAIWKVYVKAGKPGWAAIVPIYNLIVLLEIVGRPVWWIVLMLIPLVNFVIFVLMSIAFAKAFGKGAGFGIGIVFLGFIFLPLLAFSDAEYTAPDAA